MSAPNPSARPVSASVDNDDVDDDDDFPYRRPRRAPIHSPPPPLPADIKAVDFAYLPQGKELEALGAQRAEEIRRRDDEREDERDQQRLETNQQILKQIVEKYGQDDTLGRHQERSARIREADEIAAERLEREMIEKWDKEKERGPLLRNLSYSKPQAAGSSPRSSNPICVGGIEQGNRSQP